MKILIIGPSWIGDMMMSHTLYRILVKRYPGVQIDVMAPVWSISLLQYMPEVSRAFQMPFDHGVLALNKRYLLGQKMKQNNYQQAIILPNSFKSALVPFFAKIPQRTGWLSEMRYGLVNDLRILDKNAFPLMVHRYAALAFDYKKMRSANDLPRPMYWPKLNVSVTDQSKILNNFMINDTRPIIGLCFGSEFGPAKCWPYYHYVTLAKELIHRGYQIALLGSINDYITGNLINNAFSMETRVYCHNLVGKTSLEQVIKIIAACNGIISNDSGLMHIASALDRPLVALYGPSSPNFTPPLSHRARVIRLIDGYYKIRKGDDKQGYHNSLIAIQPNIVLNELESLLISHKEN